MDSRQLLGVPLNAHTELLAFVFDGLDQAVFGARRDPHARSGRLDALMVQAVDGRRVFAERFGHPRSGLDLQRVVPVGRGQLMRAGLRKVGRDVVEQRASADSCQQLHPVADPQHWKASFERFGDQVPIEIQLLLGCEVEIHA